MAVASNQKHLNVIPTDGLVVISLYIAAQLLSDIASLKISLIAGFSLDAGTFIYPLTFTIRDLVHKRLGKLAARKIIILAAGLNLFMALFFYFVAWLPQDPTWGLGKEFSAILGPVWRIVIASIMAEVFSELVDTEIYHLWQSRITTKYQWMRVLSSNAVSIPIDSLIFCWGAFGFLLPHDVVWSIFFANVIVKGAVTIISLPSIYLVKEK
ncbi:Putative preQ0 transporter YhhQ [Olavius sp. associated proteobacterium Delta 1]|nr:Putative preQ0 transporter YhhQ [Olavius sp. associated proteobacterium Delta 1]